MAQQNGQNVTANELRNVALFLEDTVLDTFADFAEIQFPFARGNLRDFPRPSPQDQAAAQGFAVLRESTEQAVAALYALAAVLDTGRQLPSALLVPVQPYIDAFRARPTVDQDQAA